MHDVGAAHGGVRFQARLQQRGNDKGNARGRREGHACAVVDQPFHEPVEILDEPWIVLDRTDFAAAREEHRPHQRFRGLAAEAEPRGCPTRPSMGTVTVPVAGREHDEGASLDGEAAVFEIDDAAAGRDIDELPFVQRTADIPAEEILVWVIVGGERSVSGVAGVSGAGHVQSPVSLPLVRRKVSELLFHQGKGYQDLPKTASLPKMHIV